MTGAPMQPDVSGDALAAAAAVVKTGDPAKIAAHIGRDNHARAEAIVAKLGSDEMESTIGDVASAFAGQTITLPLDVVLRAYGALGAVNHHLRNLPATSEGDDYQMIALTQAAFDAITEATDAR